MRIAISGSHSLGKSTFVADFCKKHSDYIYEQEPYRALMNDHEILFRDSQTQQHIDLQLNYCLDRVKQFKPGAKVIFDRPPCDYIPYSDYTAMNADTDIDAAYVESLYARIRPVIHHLDLIVFIPKSDDYPIQLEADGHRPPDNEYRDWVDARFKKLYREQLDQLMPAKNAPKIIEVTGTREGRITTLEAEIAKLMKA